MRTLLFLLLLPITSQAQTNLKLTFASDHFKPRNPAAQGCECSRERFVEKNWGIGLEKYEERGNVRTFNLDTYIYTDSFGKPAAFIGRGKEYRVLPSLWFGYRYGLSSRHDMSDWIPIPMGYGTATLKMNDQAEATMLIVPTIVIGFGLRIKF